MSGNSIDEPGSEPATQRDLELWGGQLQHQMEGLRVNLEEKIEQRAEETEERIMNHVDKRMDEWGERIMNHIDVAVENRQVDVGMASVEQVEALAEKVDDHEVRLRVVEKR